MEAIACPLLTGCRPRELGYMAKLVSASEIAFHTADNLNLMLSSTADRALCSTRPPPPILRKGPARCKNPPGEKHGVFYVRLRRSLCGVHITGSPVRLRSRKPMKKTCMFYDLVSEMNSVAGS